MNDQFDGGRYEEDGVTYCVGVLVREGLVMMADTRTNAGVDNISSYRKLRVLETRSDRVMMVASAGSLSVTQAAINRVAEALVGRPEDDDPAHVPPPTLDTVGSVFAAAELVGRALHDAKAVVDAVVGDNDKVSTGATLLLGGSIGGRRPRLFLIYGSGNFIECQPDTPFLQIGEHKYGKPILDRMITFDTPLAEATKTALISFSSTIRSNLAVGLPIDLATVRAGTSALALHHRIEAEDEYFGDLNERWSHALRKAQAAIPLPPYGAEEGQGRLGV